ncbi:FixH family protein [Aquimarina sp. U1-2]|uniref:FixH family protein n=1 Tax=Aquimarina sp. U1-2 TaxID=2823141 RepID=UPI001AEC74BC|nr:FixH family protein [Aquimarina sp. U1-2]MBP2831482.1 FixH family protein [Aquimarina sp. U1-2]
MKINWGTSIVLVFIGFISFVMYFVVKMNMHDKYQHDLVTKEYYKKELNFQQEMNAEKNARALKHKVAIQKLPQGILVTFPEDKDYVTISGTIYMYRPSDQQLDFQIPIALEHHKFLIPDEYIVEGRWDITVDWTYQNTPYLLKESIIY